MGAQASVQIVNTFIKNQAILNLESKANATATTNCNVNIGTISFKKNKGCTVKIENRCTADAKASLDSIIDAVKSAMQTFTTEQKQQTAKLLTISMNVSNSNTVIEELFELNVRQICDTSANVNNTISIDNLIFDECESNEGVMEFYFVNAGNAVANCAMKIVTNVTVEANQQAKSTVTQGYDLNGIYNTVLWGGVAITCFLCLYSILYTLIKLIMTGGGYDKLRMLMSKSNSIGWYGRYNAFM